MMALGIDKDAFVYQSAPAECVKTMTMSLSILFVSAILASGRVVRHVPFMISSYSAIYSAS